MYVFAYGSNLSLERICKRVGEVGVVTVACLEGYDLRFHKRGRDGSGKADAYRTGDASHSVWGVVYDLDAHAKRLPDGYEGLGSHYIERWETLVTAGQERVEALLYVAHATKIDAALKPYRRYHRFVVEGAREHRLPSHYIARLDAVAALDDPNAR